jgi:hypothetical protein
MPKYIINNKEEKTMKILILRKQKKKGGYFYVVVGKSEDSPGTVIFGRYKKLKDAEERVKNLTGG